MTDPDPRSAREPIERLDEYIPGFRVTRGQMDRVCQYLVGEGWAGGVGFDEAFMACVAPPAAGGLGAPRTAAGKALLASDFDTTGWGPRMVREHVTKAVHAIEAEASRSAALVDALEADTAECDVCTFDPLDCYYHHRSAAALAAQPPVPDSQTEDLLAALAEQNIHSRGDLLRAQARPASSALACAYPGCIDPSSSEVHVPCGAAPDGFHGQPNCHPFLAAQPPVPALLTGDAFDTYPPTPPEPPLAAAGLAEALDRLWQWSRVDRYRELTDAEHDEWMGALSGAAAALVDQPATGEPS